jgi:hypothetical protein
MQETNWTDRTGADCPWRSAALASLSLIIQTLSVSNARNGAALCWVELDFDGDANNTILSNFAACCKRRIKQSKVHPGTN